MLVLDLYKLFELLSGVCQFFNLTPERFTLVIKDCVACS